MPFMDDGEFVLLFDTPNRAGRFFSVDELRRLRDAGIQTGLITGLVMDDYATLEAHLDRYRQAGLKLMLPLWNMHAAGKPREWYACKSTGVMNTIGERREYIFSPWHPSAQAYLLDTLRHCVKTYASATVQVVSCLIRDGESVMPNEALYYDEFALSSWRRVGLPDVHPNLNTEAGINWLRGSYLKLILDQQHILVEQPSREIWMMLHLAKTGRPLCGVDWIEDYYQALQELHPSRINHISFDYFNFPAIWGKVSALQRRWHTREWVGAEYCEGLKAGNGLAAIQHGRRGVVLGPCHWLNGHTALAPWMLAEIRKAVDCYPGYAL